MRGWCAEMTKRWLIAGALWGLMLFSSAPISDETVPHDSDSLNKAHFLDSLEGMRIPPWLAIFFPASIIAAMAALSAWTIWASVSLDKVKDEMVDVKKNFDDHIRELDSIIASFGEIKIDLEGQITEQRNVMARLENSLMEPPEESIQNPVGAIAESMDELLDVLDRVVQNGDLRLARYWLLESERLSNLSVAARRLRGKEARQLLPALDLLPRYAKNRDTKLIELLGIMRDDLSHFPDDTRMLLSDKISMCLAEIAASNPEE